MNLSRLLVILFALQSTVLVHVTAAPAGGALAGERYRVIVSTDIGGSDPDDFQSMVHYLAYADLFDTEGLIASPPHGGRKEHILEAIDAYESDYPKLAAQSARFPTPDALRAITRPLYILVWGSITDVAQALRDDPGIKPKLRVYFISSWNRRMDPAARDYVVEQHPDLWRIEADTTFRGMYVGGLQEKDLGNSEFLARLGLFECNTMERRARCAVDSLTLVYYWLFKRDGIGKLAFMNRIPLSVVLLALCSLACPVIADSDVPFPGERGARLDLASRADLWEREPGNFLERFVRVPRDQVVAFALYTHDAEVLKLTAQLFPLRPDETREVRLEFKEGRHWREVARAPVLYPGWSAHFRIVPWDNRREVPYRVRHGSEAVFEGLIRKDPLGQDEIVVASLSCDSNADRGDRREIVERLLEQNPDLLFFAGDQSYDHREHTAAWLLWGHRFRDVLKDRPVVTIPDDHDIGQGNIWGEGGIVADSEAGDSGGYFFPAEYINMVHRGQTWHLPDPVDPRPVAQDISVYFTRLRVGGIDFAILADRQFKSGPKGKIPQMGPRPDHIRQADYDFKTIDLPGLELLGERQMAFLHDWGQDWTAAVMKAALSQTAFCGAVHLHGSRTNRLLADLDCNGWPQTGRNQALAALRRALACHLCGDQHLAVVVQHGIEEFRDGPFGFTNPAIVNSYYGRWWWPEDEKPGARPIPGSPLPWTGDYFDGLRNRMTMIAYANPQFGDMPAMRAKQRDPEVDLGDGHGLIRFNKRSRTITFECWPRYADPGRGDVAQFPGWPVTIRMEDNDGRRATGHLPELRIRGAVDPVVQVIREADGEILYTQRIQGRTFRPRVFAPGTYTIKVGRDRPDGWTVTGVEPEDGPMGVINVRLR